MFICTGPKPQRFIRNGFCRFPNEWRILFSHQLDLFLDERFAKMNMFCGISKRSTSPQASLKTDGGLKTPKVLKISGFSKLTLLPVPQITNVKFASLRIAETQEGNFNHLPRKSTFLVLLLLVSGRVLGHQNDTEVFIRCVELLQGYWTEGC